MSDAIIIISLVNIGFFGGLVHCSQMCGPLVFTQVSNRLKNIPIAEFSTLKKLQNFALLPYHFGRITTYSFLGFFCSFFAKNIKEIDNLNFISSALLFIASLIFFSYFFEKKPSFFRIFRASKPIALPKFNFMIQLVAKLFKNPRGLNGYFLGIILGFLPCGMLYGAFILAAEISNPFLASIGMLLFGMSTFPALFLTASGLFFVLKSSGNAFKKFSKIVILINAVALLIMSINIL
jgi:sulfite exporter TauE/SafE